MVENKHNQKVNVLSVYFDNVTLVDMRLNVKKYFEQQQYQSLFIVTANPEIVDYASNHKGYRDLINSADYVIADGTGVVKAARLLKTPLSERVPGIELMEECLKLAHTNKQRVFLLGSKEEVVSQARNNLATNYPNVTFAHHHGYIDLNDDNVLETIKDFNPDYVFVAMGYPKQEQWIKTYKEQFKQTVLMGVGGSLEVFGGVKKRAPKLIRKLNLEWVYRVVIDWKRLGRTKSIPIFLFKVWKQMRTK
ncbi:N-acetylglucosaminyldiphosphoundecaprenol N-acetyl-beta-D-mannosaminyltransferase TarA [Staphylococcus kloosii]|uniref:N-acetylglucosaminyldiphosphoundecaprenol N-acetyl-beta-D-mannosaminyltransferase TarA n=1 Tax=Staphylococcus kloosii TaxID=29384 RepID=UPI0028A3ADB9|nr:N-acetylglucosaminyldiphosphoundecaprenol N-acetyl-beta-D-mannosaminyltransferase TarA [Staphylococcus kloosii]MDT3959109.1 N-acetylglucosaminyldiphosphoundecaprenol N-acetyl-beta-D-mannosaminyltransferase TarA [Staphylococcus kloosii]